MKPSDADIKRPAEAEVREEFPTGNRFLDKWGPKFVKRSTEFVIATVLAIPLNVAFLVFLFFSDTTLLWSVVSGTAVAVISVLFIMVICEIIRNVYLNVQDEKRRERDEWLAEQARLKAEEEERQRLAAEEAAKQREAAEAARLAAIVRGDNADEEAPAAPVTDEKTGLPELAAPALADAMLPSLSDAGVVVTRADLLQLLCAMQAARVVRFAGIPFSTVARLAQVTANALGNFRGNDYSTEIINIIPLDGTAGDAANRVLLTDRDKIRMPFVDEADRKKEFLPDMAQDNWNDCRVWYFVLMPDAYGKAALDDWTVTVNVMPTIDAALAEKTAMPVASAASLTVLSGRAPTQNGGESFAEAVDALDDFLLSAWRTAPSNPLVRTAERFAAAALDAGFTPAETADRFLSCVRLPALLRGKKAFCADDLTALGEKLNALFGYDNLPLSRKLLSEAPRAVQTAGGSSENA